jgi:hypothetical protein
VKVGDLIEWNLHSIRPKALIVGFNGDFAKLYWFKCDRFSSSEKISYVGKRELKVVSESR